MVDQRDALFAGDGPQLLLQLGELTVGELRAVRAVIGLLRPNERERVVLQCLLDAWVAGGMSLPGDVSYGEALLVFQRFGLDVGVVEARIDELEALAKVCYGCGYGCG